MNLADYRNVWKDDATCNIDKKDKWWIFIHEGWRYRIKQYFVIYLLGFLENYISNCQYFLSTIMQ